MTTTTSRKSLASAALATLSIGLWACTRLPDPVVLSFGAACVVLAYLGLRDIRRSEGRLGGGWLAIGGVLAEAAAVVVFLGLLPAVRNVQEAARRMVET